MSQKTVVIYHRADFDGIFCREIAKKFLPHATLIGWDYNDPEPGKDVIDGTEALYILDLSVPPLMDHPNLIWIDHHKSAIEKYPSSIPGYRIDGVAACRLAWQWFVREKDSGRDSFGVAYSLPEKKHFIERIVGEPWAVRLAGEYDIWDKRDPDAELFQHGLRSEELFPVTWDALLSESGGSTVIRLLNQGRALQYTRTEENRSIINAFGFDVDFEGLRFLACNHARFNSHLFAAALKPEHDACLGFNWTGKCWKVSLYHAPGKEQHDLSNIASRYGGGGHRGACGFVCHDLPFSLK